MTVIQVTSTTLFHLATSFYGDARLWTRIAEANGLSNPIVSGVASLVIPAANGQGRPR